MVNRCEWEKAENFNSYSHYERVLAFIRQQMADGEVREVKVRRRYSGLETLDEHWFKCLASKETWRIVAPDPPFKGVFEKV